MQRLHLTISMLSIAALAGCGDSSPLAPPAAAKGPLADAAFTLTQVNELPVYPFNSVPCANGGAGEDVLLSGTIHQVFHITSNANGFHLTTHQNPGDVTGTGQTTGDTYHGAGSSTYHLNVEAGQTVNSTNNFQLIGEGSASNLTLHVETHLTINANGEVTVSRSDSRIECD